MHNDKTLAQRIIFFIFFLFKDMLYIAKRGFSSETVRVCISKFVIETKIFCNFLKKKKRTHVTT